LRAASNYVIFSDICKLNVMKKDMHPAQLRAARALAGWSREHLAEAAGTTERTIARIEAGETAPRGTTVAAIRAALEAAGVEFTNGDAPGVRLRKRRGSP
jgi:transcriptional regulator with XRE-family HTH domain